MSGALKTVVSWTLFPSMLVAALLTTLGGIRAGFDLPMVVMAVIVSAALPLLLLQRWMPFERDWVAQPKNYSIDLLHMVTTGITTDAMRAAIMAVVLTVAVELHGTLGSDLWPTSWPLLAQFAVGLLIGDLGAYWVHRSCHRFPLMWRVHAMHHSSEKMYLGAAVRNHPFNAILMHSSHLLPLTLLGAPVEVIALTSVFTGVNGMMQHVNIDLRLGWFNRVFATADLHRWHHSADFEESNRNFGNNLIIWDWLFATRYLPGGRPEQVGLGDVRLPENYWAHLASPLFLNRLLIEVREELSAEGELDLNSALDEPQLTTG
jgi:sterol desaturase/sphingolipid hydroxylase (fatty acid hydroxylase superfamily)